MSHCIRVATYTVNKLYKMCVVRLVHQTTLLFTTQVSLLSWVVPLDLISISMQRILFGFAVVAYLAVGVFIRLTLALIDMLRLQLQHIDRHLQYDRMLTAAYDRVTLYLQQGGLVIPELPEEGNLRPPTESVRGARARRRAGVPTQSTVQSDSAMNYDDILDGLCPHGLEISPAVYCARCNDA